MSVALLNLIQQVYTTQTIKIDSTLYKIKFKKSTKI
jgi:hypothetical protein